MAQFTATTRVPTRPLSYANKDMAYRKELIVDYTNGMIYVVDENGNIIDISEQVYIKLVQNGMITSEGIIVSIPNPDNPEEYIKVSLQEAIVYILAKIDSINNNISKIQKIIDLLSNENGELAINASDIVTDATHQFITQAQLEALQKKVSISETIVSINPSNISGSSTPYILTVAVAGLHPDYPSPILDISYSNDAYTTSEQEEYAFSNIYRCKISNPNEAIIYFREKPDISFNVRFIIFTPGLN